MTTLANALALACFLAACFRARWVALALAPAVALILASWTGLVDISSASHPARWIVPLVGALGAAYASYNEITLPATLAEAERMVDPRIWSAFEHLHHRIRLRNLRALYAAILVFGSDIVDLVALHPKIWEIPGVWAIVPLQIIVCVSVLAVLLAPERWVAKWLK